LTASSRAVRLSEIVRRILPLKYGLPTLVAVDGFTASGKTTLANELAAIVNVAGRPAIRASADDFHRADEERHRRGRYSPEGYYEDSFDYDALVRLLLAPLGSGGNRRFVTSNEPGAPHWTAANNAILILDGVFLLRPELEAWWDYSIFVDVAQSFSLERGLARDTGVLGDEAEVRKLYEERYLPGEQLYMERVNPRSKASVIVDNTDPSNPLLVWQ
jgi:uridine kinase